MLSIALLRRLSPLSDDLLTVVFMAADCTLNVMWLRCDREGLVAWVGGAGWGVVG